MHAPQDGEPQENLPGFLSGGHAYYLAAYVILYASTTVCNWSDAAILGWT